MEKSTAWRRKRVSPWQENSNRREGSVGSWTSTLPTRNQEYKKSTTSYRLVFLCLFFFTTSYLLQVLNKKEAISLRQPPYFDFLPNKSKHNLGVYFYNNCWASANHKQLSFKQLQAANWSDYAQIREMPHHTTPKYGRRQAAVNQVTSPLCFCVQPIEAHCSHCWVELSEPLLLLNVAWLMNPLLK